MSATSLASGLQELRRRRADRRALLPAVHQDPVAGPSRRLLQFLGLPRKLNLDAADLEQRFRAQPAVSSGLLLQRAPAERRASLERIVVSERRLSDAAAAGRARRVPAAARRARRARIPRKRRKQVPPALLEEVFALNEELDEIRELRDERCAGRRMEARPRARRATDRGEAQRARGSSWRSCRADGMRWSTRSRRSRSDARCSRRCASACSSGTTSTTCSLASSGNSGS